MAGEKILLVDDDSSVRFGVHTFFSDQGYSVIEATSCQEARDQLVALQPHIAVLDYRLPDGDALSLLSHLKDQDPDLPVIILTGHGSIDLAVSAMRQGAEHFLTKPVELPALQVVVERCLANRRNSQKQMARDNSSQRKTINPFLGQSDVIRNLEAQAQRVATSERPVLILGETGCGKGVLARWVHEHSPRCEEPWVELNCAGLSSELLESELFGHEKGAFTGATSRKRGLLEVANHGTLFLDEIGDMDLSIQPKLLKVLEEQRLRRVGGVEERSVDFRLVAATHQNLVQRIRNKEFRSDLFYRISTLPLEVPPLRQRPEDIPALVEHFLVSLGKEIGRPHLRLEESALKRLQAYGWPGNIRELRNVLERAALLSSGDFLTVRELRFDPPLDAPAGLDEGTSHLTLLEVERRHIERVLQERGSVALAAEQLDIPRSTLYQKIKKLGLEQD